MTRVVALDLMDTLVHDPFREALRAALGRDWVAVLAERPRDAWPRFERGELTEDEFWDVHGGDRVDRAAFDRVRRDGTTWLPGIPELLADLRRAGVPIVVATNYPSWIDDVERRLLDGVVDFVVASCRIGVRKPDPRFYAAVVQAACAVAGRDVVPSDVVFVDDRDDNVEAARTAGLHGHLFEGAAGLRAALVSLDCPVPPLAG